jgi:hypothetical protein
MLKSIGLLLLCSSAAVTSAATFDPPDLNLEYQLHQQYLIAHGDLPPSGQGLIESYQMQSGETLWGLSQMLYGDGNYWPRVWAQNRSITNPHLIRKGLTLQFQLGSEDDTPSFRFTEGEEPGLELAAASVSGNPQIEVPPPETPPKPLINVPKSFPAWQEVYKKRPDKFKIDYSHMYVQRLKQSSLIPLSAWAQEEDLQSVGGLLETEKESGLPVVNQYVYLKLKKGAGVNGQKYLIVMDRGRIHKVNSQVEGKINAHMIEVLGDVQVAEQVEPHFTSSSDRENYNVYRALILHSMGLSLTGALLVPGEVETVNMSADGPDGTAVAQVIGSSKHEASALYGPGDIVFLNKGSQDGVAVGQVYAVFPDRSIRDSQTPVTYNSRASGAVKIAKVMPGVSTAIVLRSVDSIQQGDRAQGGVALNMAPPPEKTPDADVVPPADTEQEQLDDAAPPSSDDSIPASEFDVQ